MEFHRYHGQNLGGKTAEQNLEMLGGKLTEAVKKQSAATKKRIEQRAS